MKNDVEKERLETLKCFCKLIIWVRKWGSEVYLGVNESKKFSSKWH